LTLHHDPAALPEQTVLRRAFHTLKGSSRMVGLSEFGEAAWALEQLHNAWLAEQKPASPALLSLSIQALNQLARWVDDIAAHRAEAWRAAPSARPPMPCAWKTACCRWAMPPGPPKPRSRRRPCPSLRHEPAVAAEAQPDAALPAFDFDLDFPLEAAAEAPAAVAPEPEPEPLLHADFEPTAMMGAGLAEGLEAGASGSEPEGAAELRWISRSRTSISPSSKPPSMPRRPPLVKLKPMRRCRRPRPPRARSRLPAGLPAGTDLPAPAEAEAAATLDAFDAAWQAEIEAPTIESLEPESPLPDAELPAEPWPICRWIWRPN
jgi:chemosensory pili system protein ChpA (sensor histidine kinase/response regulator)